MNLLERAKEKLNEIENADIEEGESSSHIEDCERLISKADSLGVDTSKAEEILKEAKLAYSLPSSSDISSEALAKRAKREVKKKLNARDRSRLRVLLSEQNLERTEEKAENAKSILDFEEEGSEGLELIEEAKQKRLEGDYVSSEGVAWRAKKVLEEEIAEEEYVKNLSEFLESAEDLLDYLSTLDIDIEDIEKEYNEAVERYEEREYPACVKHMRNFLKQISILLDKEKVDQIKEAFSEARTAEEEERRKKIEREKEQAFEETASEVDEEWGKNEFSLTLSTLSKIYEADSTQKVEEVKDELKSQVRDYFRARKESINETLDLVEDTTFPEGKEEEFSRRVDDTREMLEEGRYRRAQDLVQITLSRLLSDKIKDIDDKLDSSGKAAEGGKERDEEGSKE